MQVCDSVGNNVKHAIESVSGHKVIVLEAMLGEVVLGAQQLVAPLELASPDRGLHTLIRSSFVEPIEAKRV